MTLLLGVATAAAAAVSYGTADFAGGIASRRRDPRTVALGVQLIGGLALTAAFVGLRIDASFEAAAIGLIAGCGVGVGLVGLYAALARAAMGPVVAITGLVASGVGLTYDAVVWGDIPTLVQWAGIGLALAGGLFSTRLAAVPLTAGVMAVVAGAAFAGSFIAFDLGASASPVALLLAARTSAAALLGLACLATCRSRLEFSRAIFVAGGLDTVANLSMIIAVGLIPVGFATAIATAVPPIVTLFLARYMAQEALPKTAYASLAVACGGIALIVIG